MIDETTAGRKPDSAQGKRTWHKPTLSRIEASEAEVFTRSGSDGAFTTS